MNKKRNIGIDVKFPETSCNDKKCPFHGSLSLRGRNFVGIITSAKLAKSATVRWTRRYYLPKYERYEKRRTSIHAYNPLCINANEKDVVRIVECRPLSKTKHFVIVEKLGVSKETPKEKEPEMEKKAKKEK